MYILENNNQEIDYGRCKIERLHNDFTASLPNWCEVVNGNITENADTNADITRVSSASSVKIQTKLYNFRNLSGIRFELGNLTSNGIDNFYLISEDGNTKIEFKKEATGQSGLYVNGIFIKHASKKISFGVRTDITDGQDSQYFSKAQNIAFHFLPQNKSVNLIAWKNSMCDYIIPTDVAFNLNQKFRIVFEVNQSKITLSQIKLTLWKSY